MKKTLFLTFGLMLVLFSCKPKKDKTPQPVATNNQTTATNNNLKGMFIINEGAFGSSNGSVSFLDSNSVLTNNYFYRVNKRPLGDVVQSLFLAPSFSQGFIVVNNSNKVEVVNLQNFSSLYTISNLEMPRYLMAVDSTKAFVTEYVSYSSPGQVSVIDLNKKQVVKTIPVGNLPEHILYFNNKLFVANSGDSTISVIDPSSETVMQTIVSGQGPSAFEVDKNGNIWILCEGYEVFNTDYTVDTTKSKTGSIVKMDAGGNVLQTLSFNSTKEFPSSFTINKTLNQLYYCFSGKTYSMSINATSLPTAPFINRSFYGIDTDPFTGDFWGANSGDFSSAGYAVHYKSDGTLVDSLKAGIGPNGFVFN